MTGGHHHRATLKQVSCLARDNGQKLTCRIIKVSNRATLRKAHSKPLRKVSYRVVWFRRNWQIGKIATPSASHKPAKNVSASSKKARINAQAQKRELKRRNVGEDIKFFSTSSGGSRSLRFGHWVGLTKKVRYLGLYRLYRSCRHYPQRGSLQTSSRHLVYPNPSSRRSYQLSRRLETT